MAKANSIDNIVDTLSGLTVLEAAELVKVLEEKWGVSAAAPVAVAAASASAAPAAAVEEQTEFNVILASFDAASKINIIKEVRAITGLGLAEAKALVESTPKALKEAVSKAEAESLKAKFEGIGAKIELK
ncbi:MAG: 50S ribosomal protein L7/L12 [Rickettsiaceae bacterium]|nr:50S ribosomal protein L7/L12 [Rickettsiaceae bacterium]